MLIIIHTLKIHHFFYVHSMSANKQKKKNEKPTVLRKTGNKDKQLIQKVTIGSKIPNK